MRNEMNTLYIMLGNECNLHCRYCVQRNLVEHPIARHISPKFWKFFMSIRDNVRVVFYGGEPLLYFPAIKEIVTRRPNLSYHMPSNCKLLTDEMVDFLISTISIYLCRGMAIPVTTLEDTMHLQKTETLLGN